MSALDTRPQGGTGIFRSGIRLALVAALMLLAGGSAQAETGPAPAKTGISQDQAKSLVLAWLKEHGVRLDSSEFDLESEPDDPEIPDFYLFSAYTNTRTSLKIIGAYAVGRRTAAVWQRLDCQELKSENLEKLKDKLLTPPPETERPGSITCF